MKAKKSNWKRNQISHRIPSRIISPHPTHTKLEEKLKKKFRVSSFHFGKVGNKLRISYSFKKKNSKIFGCKDLWEIMMKNEKIMKKRKKKIMKKRKNK